MLDELQGIDVTAIEELRAIKAEQETLQGRLAKLGEKQGEVSDVVFDRVKKDYETRLNELDETARPLMQQARGEFSRLADLLERMAKALENARLDCEEIELRNELGELDAEQFEQRMQEARETLERSESELSQGEALKQTFVSAVRSEDELLAHAEPESSEEPEPAPSALELTTDEDGPDKTEEINETDEKETAEQVEADDDQGAPPELELELDEESEAEAEPSPEGQAPPPSAPATEEIAPPARTAGIEIGRPSEPEQPEPTMDEASTSEMPRVLPDPIPPPPPDFDPFEPDEPVPPMETSSGAEPTQMFAIARLVATRPGLRIQEHRLNPTETMIGRAPDNDICIEDGSVSRRHAKVVLGADGYTVIDLGSENGVYVNHERVAERLLVDGDLIELGPGSHSYIFRGA